MATATTNGSKVIKPDHGAERKHMIFTQEHEDLRESMQAWVQKELWPHRNEWEETTWPNEVIKRAGDLGFLGLCFPEEYGGQGGDYYYSLVRAECMSYTGSGGLNMGFVVHTDMVLPPIEMLGTDDLKSRYLPKAIAGDTIGCLGITEPDVGSDVANIRTSAIRDGDEFVVNGSKMFITNGARADFIVLVVKTDPSKAPRRDQPAGRRPARRERRDGPRLQRLAQAREDGDARLRHRRTQLRGRAGPGRRTCSARRARASTTSPGSSRASGWSPAPAPSPGAQRMFERTLEYAKERKAFGRSIGNFQVIRHKFAEMATKIEAARQFTYATAWRYKNGEYPVREISEAKLYTSRIACEVADECIQIHGGYGYMKEYEIERAYRDVRLNRIGAGTDEIMLEVIGRSFGI